MEDDRSRFRCHPEPSGTWTVWDEVDNAPASLGGCSLVGRTWQRAKVACDLLTRIYDNRLEARSHGRLSEPVDRVDDLISSIRKSRSFGNGLSHPGRGAGRSTAAAERPMTRRALLQSFPKY
jgi:hypothetical protein